MGKLGRSLPTETGVGPFSVIVRAPGGQRDAGVVQGREQGLVQQFAAQATVESLPPLTQGKNWVRSSVKPSEGVPEGRRNSGDSTG